MNFLLEKEETEFFTRFLLLLQLLLEWFSCFSIKCTAGAFLASCHFNNMNIKSWISPSCILQIAKGHSYDYLLQLLETAATVVVIVALANKNLHQDNQLEHFQQAIHYLFLPFLHVIGSQFNYICIFNNNISDTIGSNCCFTLDTFPIQCSCYFCQVLLNKANRMMIIILHCFCYQYKWPELSIYRSKLLGT